MWTESITSCLNLFQKPCLNITSPKYNEVNLFPISVVFLRTK